MSKELKQRLIIAALGIPVMLLIFQVGGISLIALMGLVSFLGAREYDKLLLKNAPFAKVVFLIITFFSYTLTICYKFLPIPGTFIDERIFIFFSALIVVICLFVYPYSDKARYSRRKIALSLFGWLYIGVFPASIYYINSDILTHGLWLSPVVLLLVAIWLTDSVAYFVGMKFGKHRGIFKASPNKSLEGYLAGFAAPFIIGYLILMLTRAQAIWYIEVAVISLCAGLFGQFGDLLESKLKRIAGVKDSSNLIPGHGGILDRFDSLLIAAPAYWLIWSILVQFIN